MSTHYEPTLAAFAEEIRERSWREWLIAHTSFLKPLHRWEGTLWVDRGRIRFEGRGRWDDRPLKLTIPSDDIVEIRYGFDECFRRREDRQLGLFEFQPLRLRYRADRSGEETLYLFAAFRRGVLGRHCENRKLADRLAGRHS